MLQIKWIVYSVLGFSILSTGSAIFAEDTKDNSPKVKGEKKHEKKKTYELNARGKKMVEVCKLDEEQTNKLANAMMINKLKLKKFKNTKATNSDKTNTALMRELSNKMREARKAKDKETYKALKKQREPLKKEENRIKQESKERIESILTDKQKYDWAGYFGGWMAWRPFKRMGVKLTDDQKAQIITLCQGSGKEFHEAKDYKTRRKIYKKIHEQIDATILTPEQREIISKRADEKERKAIAKKKAAKSGETKTETKK